MTKYIVDGNFCEIVTDKFVEQGVKRGRLVYVAGHRALPIAENDPYTQRIKFMVHLLEGESVKPMLGLFLMDPDSLAKVDDNKQEKLEAIFKDEFQEEDAIAFGR